MFQADALELKIAQQEKSERFRRAEIAAQASLNRALIEPS